MFRKAIAIGQLISRDVVTKQHNFKFSTCAFFQQNPNVSKHRETLMKLADDYAKEGEIRNAETIYKTLIDIYPTYRAAYQQLWNSWVGKRNLMVTGPEFEYFEKKYREHIEPLEQTEKKSKPKM